MPTGRLLPLAAFFTADQPPDPTLKGERGDERQ
jgi:hypothetical protein